jgi:hypothetical protein
MRDEYEGDNSLTVLRRKLLALLAQSHAYLRHPVSFTSASLLPIAQPVRRVVLVYRLSSSRCGNRDARMYVKCGVVSHHNSRRVHAMTIPMHARTDLSPRSANRNLSPPNTRHLSSHAHLGHHTPNSPLSTPHTPHCTVLRHIRPPWSVPSPPPILSRLTNNRRPSSTSPPSSSSSSSQSAPPPTPTTSSPA